MPGSKKTQAKHRAFRLGWCAIVLVYALLSPLTARADQSSELAERLGQFSTGKVQDIGGKAIAARGFLPKLYAALGGQLAWTRQDNVVALAEAVARSWEDGLIASDFHADFVKAEAASPTSGVDRDLVLSDALVRLLYQLYFGKVDPNGIDPNWNFTKPVLESDPAKDIAAALSVGGVAGLIERTRLKHPLYIELKALIQQYTNFDVAGGWGLVPTGPALKPGQSDPRIGMLRKRLATTGEYEGAVTAGDVFDAQLVAALKTFQTLHGIEADGVLGADTITALNVTPGERIEQIRVNLERGRWLLRSLGPSMVVVNVAGQYLHLFLDGEKVWSTRVIVGKTYTKTPIFTETMKTIVFNPDWTVPRSIVKNEIFAKAANDPGYLAANNYYVSDGSGRPIENVDWASYTPATFPYGIVQRPGPRNALGLVKFLFPNKYSVYLHDTPSRQLFDKVGRNFSHGCIRVENPLKLAELLMARQRNWPSGKVNEVVASGKMQSVSLPQPLPVLVLYWTVDPSPREGTAFYKDVYGRDVRLLKALNADFKPKVN